MVGDAPCKKVKEVIPSTEQNTFRDEPPWDGLGY